MAYVRGMWPSVHETARTSDGETSGLFPYLNSPMSTTMWSTAQVSSASSMSTRTPSDYAGQLIIEYDGSVYRTDTTVYPDQEFWKNVHEDQRDVGEHIVVHGSQRIVPSV